MLKLFYFRLCSVTTGYESSDCRKWTQSTEEISSTHVEPNKMVRRLEKTRGLGRRRRENTTKFLSSRLGGEFCFLPADVCNLK